MDERPEPERIEIELTTNVEVPGRAPHRHDQPPAPSSDVVVHSDQVSPTGWLASDRGRLIVTASVVGLVALVLGWSLGRVGGSGEVALSGVTTPESTVPPTTVVLVGETLPVPQITTTVPKPRGSTTTSTPPAPVIELVEVDQRLQGRDIELVGVDNTNSLVELDLAAGTITRQSLGRASVDSSGGLIAGTDWIILSNPSSGVSTLFRDDGRSRSVDIGYGWQPLWIVGTERFWRGSDSQPWGAGSTFIEVDMTGQPTGPTVELPAGTWPLITDADGGLVVLAAGKNYSVHESSIDLIGSGDLLGLSSELSVSRDCDAQLQCGIRVTDRRTGDVRPVPTDPALDEAPLIQGAYGWGVTGNSISPDGGMCVVVVQSSQGSTLGLVDLRTGALIELGNNFYIPVVVWSPDGRFAFFLDDGGLRAYDRTSAEVFSVLQDAPRWTLLTSRPNGS